MDISGLVTSVYKTGLLRWEASVEYKTIVYYFTGFTKAGAMRKATHYMGTLPGHES